MDLQQAIELRLQEKREEREVERRKQEAVRHQLECDCRTVERLFVDWLEREEGVRVDDFTVVVDPRFHIVLKMDEGRVEFAPEMDLVAGPELKIQKGWIKKWAAVKFSSETAGALGDDFPTLVDAIIWVKGLDT